MASRAIAIARPSRGDKSSLIDCRIRKASSASGNDFAGATKARFSSLRASIPEASFRSVSAAAHSTITEIVGNKRSTCLVMTNRSIATTATASANSASRFRAAMKAAKSSVEFCRAWNFSRLRTSPAAVSQAWLRAGLHEGTRSCGAIGKERGLIIHLDLEIAFGAIDVSQLLHWHMFEEKREAVMAIEAAVLPLMPEMAR